MRSVEHSSKLYYFNSLYSRAKRWIMFFLSPKKGQVYFQKHDLDNLPELPDISPMYVKELDIYSESEINEWINVIGQAFSRGLNRIAFEKGVIDHDEYDVMHTYALMEGKEYIGFVSEAVFKKNKRIGVTHYLGVKKSHLGKGLGKYLILYTLHKIKEHGLMICEGESRLEYKNSLYIHFDFGFLPKKSPDYWNAPNETPWPFNFLTNKKFYALYSTWQRRKR